MNLLFHEYFLTPDQDYYSENDLEEGSLTISYDPPIGDLNSLGMDPIENVLREITEDLEEGRNPFPQNEKIIIEKDCIRIEFNEPGS